MPLFPENVAGACRQRRVAVIILMYKIDGKRGRNITQVDIKKLLGLDDKFNSKGLSSPVAVVHFSPETTHGTETPSLLLLLTVP